MSDSIPTIVDRLDELEDCNTKQLIWNERVAGRDGANGKLGRISDEVSGLKKMIVAVTIAALSALGGAVGAAWKVASESGAKDARLERLERDASDLRDEIRSLVRERRWNRPNGE